MDTKFQSKTFMFGFPEGEQFNAFKDDINIIKTFDSSKFEEIIKHIKRIILADTEKEEYKIYNEIVESKLIENHSIINSFHKIVNSFLKSFSDENAKDDSPEIIIRDISKKLKIEEEELSSIKNLLTLIKQNVEWYKQKELKESFEKGLFPFLKGIGTTVELRGVFNREIKLGEDINSYAKEIEINKENPVIPTISISINLDSGTPNRFCFQSSPENIEWLIEELKAALHKSKMLEEKFNVKNN